jgi:hypothetical protein
MARVGGQSSGVMWREDFEWTLLGVLSAGLKSRQTAILLPC